MKTKRIVLTFFGVSALILNWFHHLKSPVYAQSTLLDHRSIQYTPPVLRDRGRPDGRQSGAASRSSCLLSKDDAPPLTALVPAATVTLDETESITESDSEASDLSSYEAIFSLTTETHPSFWFYIPAVSGKELTLEFVFQNEQGDTIYQNTFTDHGETGAGEAGGIVKVMLPETLPDLVQGESYQWYFIAHCNDVETANSSPYVKGWIEKTELDVATQAQLSIASNLEKAAIYAENSIWHDTLATLRDLGLQEPDNVAAQDVWMNLLLSVGLDAVADKPIVDCCTFFN